MGSSVHFYKEKVVLVTGASSGIGRSLALQFSRHGSHVVLFSRSREKLETVAEECRIHGVRTMVCVGDVESPEDLRELVESIRKQFGRLDVLIANAGSCLRGEFPSLTTMTFRKQFETNFFGVLDSIYATLPLLTKNQGQIGIVGSAASYISVSGGLPYTTSKFAVRALAQGLRSELQNHGVSVTLITPGYIDTPMLKASLKRDWKVMSPERASVEIILAMEKRKSEVTLTLFAKIALLGARLFPNLTRAMAERFSR